MSNGSPSNEIQQPAAEIKTFGWAVRYRWVVLVILIFVQTTFGAVFDPTGGTRDYGFLYYAIIGVFLTQPIHFAIWAVFAPQRYFVRFLWAFLFCAGAAFIMEKGFFCKPGNVPGMFLVIDIFIFFAAFYFLSIIRLFSGWKLQFVDGDSASDYLPHQFGIQHLIFLTTITAVALSLLNGASVLYPNLSELTVMELFRISMHKLAILLPMGIIFWAILAIHRNILASLLFCLACSGMIELAVCSIFMGNEHVFSIQFAGLISFAISALTLRLCGYRMVRVRKRGTEEQEKPHAE
jgi:hypothetical protein